MRYLIHFRPGETWESGKSIFEQSLEEHGLYMQSLYDSKKLLMGGPFLDDQGGTAIIEADSQEEANQILSECPSIIHKVFEADMHPLLIVFDRASGVSLRKDSNPAKEEQELEGIVFEVMPGKVLVLNPVRPDDLGKTL